MSFNYITKHTSTLVERVKKFLVYFWGTHDGKYVVDHNGNRIVFFDNSFVNTPKNTSTLTEDIKNV